MSVTILFAGQQDEEGLREILWENGMDLCGDINEHFIYKVNNKVLAGGKIIEYEPNNFYLVVLGVQQGNCGQGIGGHLLTKIVMEPAKYCKHPISGLTTGGLYTVSTISKGNSTGFYKKYGFKPCNFSRLPLTYREQCHQCSERDDCNPVPMIYETFL